MKRLLFYAFTVLSIASCGSEQNNVLNITASDMADSSQVVVYKLNVNNLRPVDTVLVVGGKAGCRLEGAPSEPDFYYVYAPDKPVVALVLSAGEHVDVNLDDCSVSGSDESELFNRIESEYSAFSRSFLEKAGRIAEMKEPEARKAASEELSRSFVEFKKNSIRQIMTSPASITNVPILFRKITPDMPVFGDVNDVYLMQTVYDTLSVLYPESSYVASLKNEITARNGRRELGAMISSAQTVPYPDITLPDLSGHQRKLSEFDGRVTLLLFWSTSLENSSVLNAELKNLYARYHDSGLEIYQVAFDVDKASWAGSVRSQNIPWVSVVDTQGTRSAYISLYSVKSIPSAYVIGRDGSILAKDQVDMDRLGQVISSALK